MEDIKWDPAATSPTQFRSLKNKIQLDKDLKIGKIIEVNRNLIIAVVAIIVLAAGGFFFVSNSNKTVAPSDTSSNAQNSSGNAFTSIKDALTKSVSLQCVYTDERGIKTTANIKNGAVRADIVAKNEEESGSIIVKDKKMYFWNEKSAFMMDLSSTEVTGTPGSNQEQNQEKDLMEGLEKYKENCKPAVVSDSLFTPPSDVKFQDFSQMLKDAQKAMPTVDAKQYQQILEQLTPPSSQ